MLSLYTITTINTDNYYYIYVICHLIYRIILYLFIFLKNNYVIAL